MTSAEFEALNARLAAAPPPPVGETLIEQRARIEAMMAAIPLAAGTHARSEVIGGVPCEVVTSVAADESSPIIVYLHGGGFRLCSAAAYRAYGSHLANCCASAVIVVDYRLAPEHPYPAALDDTMAVYRAVVEQHPHRPVVLAGDSAGGGLATSAVLRCRAEMVPTPRGVVATSPWADVRNTAPSFTVNASTDRMFSLDAAGNAAASYLAGHDPNDPMVSPVLGEWGDAPPFLIHVGSGEVLLDDATALASVLGAAGGEVEMIVAEGMPHIWPTSYPAYPEAVTAVEQIAAFVARVSKR